MPVTSKTEEPEQIQEETIIEPIEIGNNTYKCINYNNLVIQFHCKS